MTKQPNATLELARPHSPKTHFSLDQIRRLSEFRYVLRRFLQFSKQAAGEVGLHSQQYQLLQAVAGIPEDVAPTIACIAQRMCLRHNSAVELVNRTIEQGWLRKCPDPLDHRRILLHVTAAGDEMLNSLIEFHLREIEELGPDLIRALKRVLSLRDTAPQPHKEQAADLRRAS